MAYEKDYFKLVPPTPFVAWRPTFHYERLSWIFGFSGMNEWFEGLAVRWQDWSIIGPLSGRILYAILFRVPFQDRSSSKVEDFPRPSNWYALRQWISKKPLNFKSAGKYNYWLPGSWEKAIATIKEFSRKCSSKYRYSFGNIDTKSDFRWGINSVSFGS